MAAKICKRENNWFDAIVKGDTAFVSKNVQSYKRMYDNRKTKDNVRQGWAAIHYAAFYGRNEIIQILLPYEYDLLTDKPHEIDCPSSGGKVTVESGSSFVHIISITGQTPIMQYVIQQLDVKDEYKDLAGCKNDHGFSVLLQAPIADSDASLLWVRQERIIRSELKGVNSLGQSIVHITALLGSPRYAEYLRDLVTGDGSVTISDDLKEKARGVLKEFFETNDKDGNNWLALVDKPQAPYPSKLTPEDRQRCKAILQELRDMLQ